MLPHFPSCNMLLPAIQTWPLQNWWLRPWDMAQRIAFHQNFLEEGKLVGGASIVWHHFWPMLLRGQTKEFHTLNIHSFCPLCRTALVLAFWSFANLASHTLHRCGLLDYNHSLVRTESCWKEDSEEFFHIVHSHLTSFNMPLVCLGALHWHPPNSVDR